MPILKSDYRPSLLFRSGHINTIYPYIFRKSKKLPFVRERFVTSDDDFVDLDFLHQKNRKKLVILCHGLEGSSDSQYMIWNADLLYKYGWNVMCFNYRGCSGEMNNQLQMYHSGWTTDLHEIVSRYKDHYGDISLLGFSLGANMILKYTTDGIYPLPSNLRSIVAISTPADLSTASQTIIKKSNFLYDRKFIETLINKVRIKHRFFPDQIPIEDLKKVKNVWDFDEYFTGPLNGYTGAEDYYKQCSAKQFLSNVHLPTLMITAADDPFFTNDSMPYEAARATSNLYFMPTKFGGHVGFTTFGSNYYWNEIKTQQFFEDPHSFVHSYGAFSSEL